MAKKDVPVAEAPAPKAPVTKKRTPVPESVQNLKQDLEDLTKKADEADALETSLDAANAKIATLKAALDAATARVKGLEGKASLTDQDISNLHLIHAEVAFLRDFKSGKPYVTIASGHRSGYRKTARGETLLTACMALRAALTGTGPARR